MLHIKLAFSWFNCARLRQTVSMVLFQLTNLKVVYLSRLYLIFIITWIPQMKMPEVDLAENQGGNGVRRYAIRHKKIGDVRWYFCNYCSSRFKKPSDLIRHFRTHTLERPFKVHFCICTLFVCFIDSLSSAPSASKPFPWKPPWRTMWKSSTRLKMNAKLLITLPRAPKGHQREFLLRKEVLPNLVLLQRPGRSQKWLSLPGVRKAFFHVGGK